MAERRGGLHIQTLRIAVYRFFRVQQEALALQHVSRNLISLSLGPL